jgi:hypothetical protein
MEEIYNKAKEAAINAKHAAKGTNRTDCNPIIQKIKELVDAISEKIDVGDEKGINIAINNFKADSGYFEKNKNNEYHKISTTNIKIHKLCPAINDGTVFTQLYTTALQDKNRLSNDEDLSEIYENYNTNVYSLINSSKMKFFPQGGRRKSRRHKHKKHSKSKKSRKHKKH